MFRSMKRMSIGIKQMTGERITDGEKRITDDGKRITDDRKAHNG